MNWFWKRKPAPQPPPLRTLLPGELVDVLLRQALAGRLAPHYRHLATKRVMARTTTQHVEQASRDSYLPRLENRWECEDQARALVHHLQLAVRAEPFSHACGLLIALDATDPTPDARQDKHCWVWAIVAGPQGQNRVALFDATARRWTNIGGVTNVHHSES